MVNLYVYKNLVFLDKGQLNWKAFADTFLCKYEDQLVTDYRNTKISGKVKLKIQRVYHKLYTEDQYFIKFARGLLDIIPPEEYTISSRYPESILIPDVSQEDIKKSLTTFDLRDDQITAVNKCLKIKRGIIQLPTATGKSAIITSVIKHLLKVNPSMHVLTLAPTVSTVKNINDTFETNGLPTEIFGKFHLNIFSPVTTSLVQSLIVQSATDPELLNSIDAVIYDECLAGETKVLAASTKGEIAYKEIQEVCHNDLYNRVLSYNLDTKTYEIKTILRKFITPTRDKFSTVGYVDPITNKSCHIACTRNHKFLTRRGYVPAEELKAGEDYIKIYLSNFEFKPEFQDELFVPVGHVSHNKGNRPKYRYNLEVEDNHNYIANGIVVSNCHHLQCDTWNKLNTLLPNAEYALGFSALSINKKDIYSNDIRNIPYDSALTIGSTGRVLMHVDPSYYLEKGIIALPVVFRINNYITLPQDFDESNWIQLIKAGLLSASRTTRIVQLATMFSSYNRKVLILVSEKSHAFTISKYLKDAGVTDYALSFGAGYGYLPSDEETRVEREGLYYTSRDSLKILEEFNTGKYNILIATNHMDEGVDVKKLDVCILASGGKKDRRIIQRIGRVLRKSKTGKYAYIVDFTDSGSVVLSRQSKSRLRLYKEDIGIPSELIYDNIVADAIEGQFRILENITTESPSVIDSKDNTSEEVYKEEGDQA